ncbi:PhoX family protein [Pelomicrobium sp. G1]|uniref:PhoX family protein n=1 Tax=unclassified Pelomicrobium TaxID=2815318 RepID=UPI003F7723B7
MRRHEEEQVCNPSGNDYFGDILEVNLTRRRVFKGGLGAALGFLGLPALAPVPDAGAASLPPRQDFGGIGFDGIAPNTLANGLVDDVRLPPGYRYEVLFAWGDPIGIVGLPPGQPEFKWDASNSAEEQALQSGAHHDGMWFFPFPGPRGRSRGLLCVNHEYVDQGLLFPDGTAHWSPEKIRKSQNAHGVSVVEVWKDPRMGKWSLKRPSPFARRLTGNSPMKLSGPAAGHPLLQTAADPAGVTVLGTLNNCASGHTPWGTYLTCEENWNGYFSSAVPGFNDARTGDQRRYGLSAAGFGYRWHEFDERFELTANPNEPHRFGYVVEIDPFNPRSTPKKRTALGRLKHENAEVVLSKHGHAVVYTGDDERFEYIYKFVSKRKFDPKHRSANMDLLDEGTLYVARFNADGTGQWLELSPKNPALAGWSLAEICIRTRQAADAAGATRMDRPEWIAVHPFSKAVYCTLTNNSRRGTGSNPGPDAANPRGPNIYGHIIRWNEAGGDPAATTFTWDIFALAGDPAVDPASNINGDLYNSPDGLWFDPDGRLWIQTDATTEASSYDPGGVNASIGTNQMLAADPLTRETRRFLTGPRGCEVTGVTMTPDGKAMFVNIQHPGEDWESSPTEVSDWPDRNARPRSATIVITREDGGVIGGHR